MKIKINTIFLAGGTGTARITSGSWESRPASGSGELAPDNGDYYQVTDSAVYRYSAAIGEWVRPFVYQGTPVLDIRLRGSVLPGAEDPVWHTSGSGTNSTTTDGEFVTMTEESWAHNSIHYEHEQTQKQHFFQGYLKQTTADGANICLVIKDGVKLAWAQIGNRTDSQRFILKVVGQTGNTADYQRILVNNFTDRPRYLELYLAASGSTRGCMAFIDHEIYPSAVSDYEKLVDHGESADKLYTAGYGAGLTSGSLYFFGSTRANKTGIGYKLKECFWGRY